MATNYRKQALMDALGPDDEQQPDPLQQPDPQQTKVELPPPADVAAAPAPAASDYTPIRGADQSKKILLGYSRDKLDNTGHNTGKYNNEVRSFVDGLDKDVGVSRNGLGNMVSFLQHEKGYGNARAVGDDKIDFDGDGPLPPIDVIRADGQIVFQDPRGAAPGSGGGGDAGGDASGPMSTPGLPSFSGIPLDALLGGGDPLQKIQQAIAMYASKRPNFDALMAQLG